MLSVKYMLLVNVKITKKSDPFHSFADVAYV